MGMIKTMTKWAALAAGALLLAGCAGTKFVRPTEAQLQLGKTTEPQVVAMLGKPFQEASGISNGKTIRTLSHAYASFGAQPQNVGVTPVYGLTTVFHEGLLVSKSFVSNVKGEATDFDDRKVPQIQVGKTTQAQVQAMFGPAPGEAIYPAIKQPAGRALVYNYTEMRGFTPSTKKLVVVLDAQGTVADVEFQNQGTWK